MLTMKLMRVAFFTLLYSFHHCFFVLSDDSVDEVSGPNFLPIDLAQNSQLVINLFDTPITDPTSNTSSTASVIQNLEVVDLNDTSVLIQWQYDVTVSLHGYPSNLIIELADGKVCEDFYEIGNLPTKPSSAVSSPSSLMVQSYLITGLKPVSNYRVRIIPIFLFSEGRGYPSIPLVISTLPSPINYWEQIFPRRTSKIWYGRGFSDPVSARPHLSEGVEIYNEETHFDSEWWTDAPTLDTPVLPSGRRGQSMTLIDNYVYMFGGRTNGYSCASTLIDTLNLGNINSGLEIYPCVTKQYEVNELWTFDIGTYEWQFINTSSFNLPDNTSQPARRELHSATIVDGSLYIFGGKSRLHHLDSFGMPIMTNATDIVHNDLWKLEVDHLKVFEFDWNPGGASTLPISQDGQTATSFDVTPKKVHAVYPNNPFITIENEGKSPRNSQCIKDIMLEITFYHDCISQLQFTFQISGPVQGSPNFFPNNNHETDILLLSQIPTQNTTNCISGEYTFIFHDKLNNNNNNLDRYYLEKLYPASSSSSSSSSTAAPVPTTLPYEDSTQCCFNPNQQVHYYYSQGLLSEIIDNSLINNYTIIAQDLQADNLVGSLISATVYMQSISCEMKYEWIPLNVTTTRHSIIPTARFQASMISYNHSLFVFGGKNQYHEDLQDLYRYDIDLNRWIVLNPVSFYENPLTTGNAIGSNFLLTSYGVIRYGGYYRQPYLKKMNPCADVLNGGGTSGGSLNDLCLFDSQHQLLATNDQDSNYDNNVFLMDPITMKWQIMNITLLSSSTTDQLRNGANSANTPMTNGNNFFFYQTTYDEQIGSNIPANRYYSSLVFIPANSLQWKQSLLQVNSTAAASNQSTMSYDSNERILYDNYQISSQGNYQSFSSDSILLFGGFDSSIGSIVDGSSGGYLQDSWMLRLNAYSTKSYRQQTLQYLSSNCQWRKNPSAKNKFSTYSCLATPANPSSSQATIPCRLRDLFLLVWCAQYNQTLS